MPTDRLPPLTALRAFEAVGRSSVAEAAQELKVTRNALLHQIRVLETSLGIVLFTRSNRGLTLSVQGREYLLQVRASFEALRASSRRVRQPNSSSLLVVDCVPGFAGDFIAPRLDSFYAQHPDITLEMRALHTSYGIAEFERSGAGVAIRVGAIASDFGGLKTEKLVHGAVFPVCSPALMEGPDGLSAPEDLARFPILDSTIAPDGWPDWLAAAREAGWDVSGVDVSQARRFDMFNMSMTAAAHGGGVELGRWPMVQHWLRSGRLVEPFDLRVASERAYWLIYQPEAERRPEFVAFRDWLHGEIAAIS